MYRLHDFQDRALDRIEALEREGVSRTLLVSPTGSGKSVMAAELVRRKTALGIRALLVAHRRELITQLSDKLDMAGVDHGILMADHPRKRPTLPVQVASVQTYSRRGIKDQYDLIVTDEAHHCRSETLQAILSDNPFATVIGPTATPWRTDGKGLGEIFQDVIVAATPAELIKDGFLVPYHGFVYDAPELSGAKLSNGDLTEAEASRIMSPKVIVGNIVESWAKNASERRTVCFAAGIERSIELVREVNNLRHHGGPLAVAEHVDASTPADVRAGLLHPSFGRLARGETTFVANYGLLTEGVDVPSIDCVILARPTLSTALAIQCMGRGFRTSPETGKEYLLIHDHAGVTFLHGRPDDPRDYSLLQDAPKVPTSGEPRVRLCPACKMILDSGDSTCWACGESARRAPRPYRTVEPAKIVSMSGSPDKLKDWKKLSTREKLEQKPAGWAVREFRKRFGEFPPK